MMLKRDIVLFTWILVSLSQISGCQNSSKKQEINIVQIGPYAFDFPLEFKKQDFQGGFDSYVGVIESEQATVHFDYGFYANSLTATVAEFLAEGWWRFEPERKFMLPNVTYDKNNTPKVEILSIREAVAADSALAKGCDFVASCQHKDATFEHPVFLSQELRQTTIEIDTVGSIFRKIVYSKVDTIFFAGIHAKELNQPQINNPNMDVSITLYAENLTRNQQDSLVDVFKTIRFIKK